MSGLLEDHSWQRFSKSNCEGRKSTKPILGQNWVMHTTLSSF